MSASPTDDPNNLFFEVQNAGSGALNYSISSNEPWLQVSTLGGSAADGMGWVLSSGSSQTFQIYFNTAYLNPGTTYWGQVTIHSSNSGRSTVITYKVTTAGVSPSGSSSPPPASSGSATGFTYCNTC